MLSYCLSWTALRQSHAAEARPSFPGRPAVQQPSVSDTVRRACTTIAEAPGGRLGETRWGRRGRPTRAARRRRRGRKRLTSSLVKSAWGYCRDIRTDGGDKGMWRLHASA
eukprot:4364113-Pleurochrysis_carterae.AAC.3